MSSKPSIKGPIQISNYAVLYMDVLNQKEKLSKIIDLPSSKAEYDSFFELLRNTYGVVDGYAEMFESYLSQTTAGPPLTVPENYVQQYERMVGPPIQLFLFSDSMLYFTSLNEQEGVVPTIRLYDLLRAAACVFACGLADGNPARGGLDIGIAANFPRIGIYGPALYKAYDLESNIAKYPRVVIGSTLRDYLVASSKDPANTKEAMLRRIFAGKCLDLIYEDSDGSLALDYVGKAVREMSHPTFQEIIMNGVDFAETELKRFEKDQDEKLVSRYALLVTYLRDRIQSFWK
jgi:hypothetical protein